MKEKIKALLKEIDFFEKLNIDDSHIEKLDEDKYQILIEDRKFLLDTRDYSADKNLVVGIKITNDSPNEPWLKVHEEDNEISLRSFLESHSKNECYCIGYEFGKILSKLHSLSPARDFDWYNMFITNSNYLFYMHGVNDVADNDYILIDYIKNNKHLAKKVELGYLYKNMDIDHIFIGMDGALRLAGLNLETVGDVVYDFVRLNRIALVSEDFAKGTFDSYFKNKKPTNKFFRLLSLYEAYTILNELVDQRQGKDTKYSQEDLDGLLKMYDNFNQDVPIWT